MVHLNNEDYWQWQERQLQDWLLTQKIAGTIARSFHDEDRFLDELNTELLEIETESEE
jgi:hypothetical protein